VIHVILMAFRSIVAVHGLDGHWKNSWTADNQVFWLKDLLPHDVPNARIFSYGYDSRTWASSPVSQQYLWDHGMSLVADLTFHRESTKV
jgi:hypothetical protein